MENVEKLYNWFGQHGWYSGTATLQMTYEGAFEGFSGRASETWEYRPVIKMGQLKKYPDGSYLAHDVLGSDGSVIIPGTNCVGKPYQSLDELAKHVVDILIIKDYYHESTM